MQHERKMLGIWCLWRVGAASRGWNCDECSSVQQLIHSSYVKFVFQLSAIKFRENRMSVRAADRNAHKQRSAHKHMLILHSATVTV